MRNFKTAMLATVFGTVLMGAVAATTTTAVATPIFVRDAGALNNLFDGGAGSWNITVYVNGTNHNVRAGQFSLEYSFDQTNWTSFLTYCLEADELIGISGNNVVSGNLVHLQDSLYVSDANALTAIISKYWDNVNQDFKAAGFQVALWEITGDSTVDLSKGQFRYTQNGNVRGQANSFLSGWSGFTPRDDIWIIQRDGFQDLILLGYTPATPVMEPSTLGLLGMGVAGLLAVRRRMRA